MQNAPREHSAILLTCIKLPSVFQTFVLSIFEWPFKTGFTVRIKGSEVRISKLKCSANSADTDDETLHYVAFIHGLPILRVFPSTKGYLNIY